MNRDDYDRMGAGCKQGGFALNQEDRTTLSGHRHLRNVAQVNEGRLNHNKQNQDDIEKRPS